VTRAGLADAAPQRFMFSVSIIISSEVETIRVFAA